ncbi:MAG: rhomboid family intramembrane serine protease, partial [Verrucomicrobiota bacterium]|nr:rhomboid family intramembrane serine protease [Verrucomicrobiota bacterium]
QPLPQWHIIPASNRQEVMDWSLVLTSQRIEAEILAFPDGRAPYGLRINPLDRLRAMQAILRFQKENKGWHWHQELPAMGLRYDWSAWGWCLLLSVFAWLAWEVRPELQQMGMLKSQEVLRGGAWWQTITAVMLHGDVAHLASNLTSGIIILGLCMGRFGTTPALLIALICGAMGNVWSLWAHDEPYRGLGASGMIMGALGMMGPHALYLMRRDTKAGFRIVVSGMLAVIMLFSLWGLSPQSDVAAHFGGFVSGIAWGAVLSLCPENQLRAPRLNLLCGLMMMFLLFWAWGMALRGGRPWIWRQWMGWG